MDTSSISPPRYRNLKVRMPARLLVEQSIECNAMISSLSAGNVTMTCPQRMKQGDHAILYLHGVDRLEGVVSHSMGTILGLELQISQHKREKLVEKMMVEIARRQGLIDPSEGDIEKRTSLRKRKMSRDTLCTLADGYAVRCTILDMSLTGIAVLMDPILKKGDIVHIGKMKAKVIRSIDGGYGLELLDLKQADKKETVLPDPDKAVVSSSLAQPSLQGLTEEQLEFVNRFVKPNLMTN
jgi:hypothetical protein